MSHLNPAILFGLLLLAIAAPRFGDRWWRRAESLASRFARRKWLAVVTLAGAAIAIRALILPWFPIPVPETHDEFGYLLAADTFLHGRLTNPPHRMWIFFDTFHVLQQPTYAAQYPPAQGAVLALGQILGHPWIGVLLSMAVMTGAILWMLQGWMPPQWALLGGVFALLRLDVFSYWMNGYWSGAIAATGGALALGGLRRVIHSGRPLHAFAIACGAAVLACSRPFEGFVFCVPIAIVLMNWLIKSKHSSGLASSVRIVGTLACVLIPTILFVGYYNWRVTHSPVVFPETLATRTSQDLPIFVWEPAKPERQYANPQFTAFHIRLSTRYARTPRNLALRNWEKGQYLWKFFLGTALLIPFVTLPWMWRDRRVRLLWIECICSALALLAVIYFEPHYAAPVTAAIFGLTIQAMRHLRHWRLWGRPIGVALTRVVVVGALANLAVGMGSSLHHGPFPDSWSVSREKIAKELDRTPGNHLVIVSYGPEHDSLNEWVYNRADIDHSKIVWAREIPGQSLQPLLDYFHGRKVWIVEADASPPQLKPYCGE